MDNFVEEFKNSYEQYEIISSIGRDTWQIKLTSYDRIAVLKRIDNPEVYRKLKELKISGIPTIYSISERDGAFYAIEEFINGSTLDSLVASKGSLTPHEVREIVCKLCRILAPVHGAGLVHRDIKPSNIIITSNNEVYLIDFGIARAQNATASKDTKHLGTEFYASPEQYGFAQTDNKSDIYSIGRLMITLLTGKENADNIKTLPYSGIIARCTAVDSTKRYANVKALQTAITIRKNLVPIAVVSAVLIAAGIAASALTAGDSADTGNYSKPQETSEQYTDITAAATKESITEESTVQETEASTEAAIAETETLTETAMAETTTTAEATSQTSTQTAATAPTAQNNTPKVNAEPAAEITTQSLVSQMPTDKNGYILDALFYDGDIYSGYIYYSDISADNPYMQLFNEAPKQTGMVDFANNCSADVYANLLETGLNITINNKTLFLPNNNNVKYYMNTDLQPTNHLYVLIFSDFDNDGVKEIFAIEQAFHENGDGRMIILYCTGRFIKVNSSTLEMTLCGGETVIADQSWAEIYLCQNCVTVNGASGAPFVTYELRGNNVIKYNGIYEPGH